MTAVRLTRTLTREVVRPLLRTKRGLVRAIFSGIAPRHSGHASPARDEPADAPVPPAAPAPATTSPTASSAPIPTAPTSAAKKRDPSSERTKAELYEEAVRRNIPGRSTMNKAQLAKALGLEETAP